MTAATIRKSTYYRCLARTIAPGSPVLADHPRTVNLREDQVIKPLNDWIGRVFERENVDRTVAALIASQEVPTSVDSRTEAARRRLAEAETGLRRLHDAIKAGAKPEALVEAINAAHAQREAARAELATTPAREVLTAAEVHAMIDSLGDVGAALSEAKPERLSKLYESLDVELHYKPQEQAIEVTTTLRVANERVRGRSWELFTRLAM